jgi:hypothetical protein
MGGWRRPAIHGLTAIHLFLSNPQQRDEGETLAEIGSCDGWRQTALVVADEERVVAQLAILPDEVFFSV